MIDLSGQNVLIIGEEKNKLNQGVSASFIQYGAKLEFNQYAEAHSIAENISAMAELKHPSPMTMGTSRPCSLACLMKRAASAYSPPKKIPAALAALTLPMRGR